MCRNVKRFGLMLAITILPGCNLVLELFQPPDGPVETGSPQLKAFESESELSSYFKKQIEQRNATYSDFSRSGLEEVGDFAGAPPEAPSAEGDGADGTQLAPGSGDDFSGTTIQEVGVDEADVVKTDGAHLYIIDSVAENSVLRIVQVSPSEQIAVVSETTLEGYGRDLYLHGDKVVAITTGGGIYYSFGGGIADGVLAAEVRQAEGDAPSAGEPGSTETTDSEPINADEEPTAIDIIGIAPIGGDDFVYQRPHTIVTIVDVSTRSVPVVLSQTKFDGTQSATRMIDGVLHMVLANYQDYYFDVLPMLGRPELDIAAVEVNTLLPSFTRTDSDGTEAPSPVVTWRELYHPTDPDGFGVVTLVSLDVDNNAQFTAVGVVAEPGLIYSSLQAMYLTDTNYDWQGNARTNTDIYKFAYANRGATPVATGTVEGRILNQYSMGEYQGNLRVATTIDAQVVCGFFECQQVEEAHNSVYVLGQTNDVLSVLGSVDNIAPRETIQSARFIGERGYVVTFEQIDPLFTLDLSDPTNPRVIGELKVPGFSTFLVPMDANHLLAVGQYVPPPGEPGNWGVQVSIFDVTDFANPVLLPNGNVIIGADTGASSEATWDPKAFTYFADGGVVALPVSIYPDYGDVIFIDGDGGTSDGGTGSEPIEAPDEIVEPLPEQQGFDGLFVYSATPSGGLAELGRISTRFDEAGYWGSSFTRGVFIGDKVYAVTNLGVREAAVSNVSTVENELYYGLPFIEAPPIAVELKPVAPNVPVESGAPTTTTGISVPGAGSIDSSTTEPNSVVHNVP